MLLLTTSAYPTMRKWEHPNHGRLLTPRHDNMAVATSEAGIPWAVDNDGYGGVDAEAFRRTVYRCIGLAGCLFVNAPDVYRGEATDHGDTLAAWREWHPFLSLTGLPLSFVVQIGATVENVPWGELDAVFIGGTTEYKLGPEAEAIVREAKRRGKWAHMGRVNSEKRIGYAKSIGCDSVDGTGWAKFRDAMLPRGLRAAGAPEQMRMELTHNQEGTR